MRAGWRAIPAVRDGQVMAVDGSAFNRPSPRLPEAVRILAARLATRRPAQ
jgi:ABC-type Fe3+-hydroxamate transport system substrate-binding protein